MIEFNRLFPNRYLNRQAFGSSIIWSYIYYYYFSSKISFHQINVLLNGCLMI